MPKIRKFLLVSNDAAACSLVSSALLKQFPAALVMHCQDGDTAADVAASMEVSAIVSQRTDRADVLSLVGQLHRANRRIPIIVISAVDFTAESARVGAAGFVLLEHVSRIGEVVEKALRPDAGVR